MVPPAAASCPRTPHRRPPPTPSGVGKSPLALYRAGARAAKAFARGNDTDAAALAALGACVAALRDAHADIRRLTDGWDTGGGGGGGESSGTGSAAKRRRAAPSNGDGGSGLVAHSFDLALDEPPFLAACALLALGQLREARGELAAAADALAAAAAVFPECVAAGTARARVALAGASSAADVAAAEAALARAVAAAEALAAAEGGLVVDANKACTREAEAGDGARRALAMLLAQAGRDAEAAGQLRALGFSWRLGRGILCYPLGPAPNAAGSGSGSERADAGAGLSAPVYHGAPTQLPLVVLDGALPRPLLRRLQAAFAPGAGFWGAHGYGPRQGYFSYAFPLVRTRAQPPMHAVASLRCAPPAPSCARGPLRAPAAHARARTPRCRRTARRPRRRCSRSSRRTCGRSRCRTSLQWRRRVTPSGGRTAAATARVRAARRVARRFATGGCAVSLLPAPPGP